MSCPHRAKDEQGNPQSNAFLHGYASAAAQSILAGKIQPICCLELPLMCWVEVLGSPVGCSGCGGACVECGTRTFLVFSCLEGGHVDRCSSIRSGKAPLQGQAQHCSVTSSFPLAHIWGKVVKSQFPPPQISLKAVQSGLGFKSSCEVTGRCKLQSLTGAFGVLSPSFLLGETEKPLYLFILDAECILTSQGSESVAALEQGVSSPSTS